MRWPVLKLSAAELEALQRLALDADPHFQRAILEAIRDTVTATDTQALAAAIESGDMTAALDAVPWREVGQSQLEEIMPPYLRDVIASSATLGESFLPRGISMSFQAENPLATQWARRQTAGLIVEITDGQRDAVRALITDGFRLGIAPEETARDLRLVVGLNDRLAGAVLRLRDSGATDTAVERYANRLLQYRTRMIARTETMDAANAGQDLLWQQGRDAGQIPAEAERQWITAGKPCPEVCAPMKGVKVGLEEDFILPDNRRLRRPPAHPHCHCTIGLVA